MTFERTARNRMRLADVPNGGSAGTCQRTHLGTDPGPGSCHRSLPLV